MSRFAALHSLELHLDAQFEFSQITLYIRLLSYLKSDILICQSVDHDDILKAPCVLPPSIVEFLCRALGMPSETIKCIWDLLMDDIWGVIPPACVVNEDYEIFKEHGWDLGLSEFLHGLLFIYLTFKSTH